MTSRGRRILIALALAGGTIVAVAATARALLPGWLRGTIERVAGEAIGRDLRIAGPFDLSLSLTPKLVAGDVTLANASWGSEPFMVRAKRITIAVDLLSLRSGPVRVRELELADAHVLLERDRDGSANWAFDLKPSPAPPSTRSAGPPIRIDHAAIRGFTMVYRVVDATNPRPLTVGVDELDARVDPETGMIDVRGGGHFNDAPWDVAGRVGPFDNVLLGRDLDQALTGHIGQAALALRGHIAEPLTLGGPNVEVSIDGPDAAAALRNLGFQTRVTGAFRLHGVLAPIDDDVGVDLAASVGDVTATVRGNIGSLLNPARFDATVQAAGPDASVVGTWLGVAHLPPRAFDLAGRIRRNGRRLSLDGLKGRVGTTSLAVDGSVGEPPRCVGADLQVAASGSDLSDLSALTRLRLPAGAFAVRGRFLRRADALAIDDVEARVAGSVIHAAGTLGEPPGFDGFELTVDGAGPDLSWLSGIATIELPAEPFEVRGRVARSGAALELDGVAGRLGGLAFDATGRLVPVRGLAGTEASLHVSGDDLARIASYAGVDGLPAQAFGLDGRVVVSTNGYTLDNIDARVGSIQAAVVGHVSAPSPKDRTSLAFRVRGPALSGLAAWGIEAKLPSDPFAAAGTLRIDGGVYHVDGVTAEVGADRLELEGTLGSIPDVSALDVAVSAAGPSLAGTVRSFAATDADPEKRIPAEPYTVSGRVRRASPGFALHEVKGNVGTTTMSASGTLVLAERMLGTDLTVEIAAPDTSTLSRLIGARLPDHPIEARGRIARAEHGLLLDGVSVTLGPSYAEASGTLGEPPRFANTDLDVSVEGPDLAATLGPMTGLAPLPADSFAVSAHVDGNDERLVSDRFTARLGTNDLEGSFTVAFGGKPFVDADWRSKTIDVAELIAGFSGEADEADESEKPKGKARRKKERLIPDQPLSLAALGAFDGQLRLSAASVTFPGLVLRDVAINGALTDGTVTLHRFVGTGIAGGRASAKLSLEPKDGGYHVHTEGRIDGGRLVFGTTGESPASAPSLDLEYAVDGTGKSLHEIAATSGGWALLTLGPGQIPNTVGSFVTSDVLLALMDALNPFRKTSPQTNFECGVAAAGIEAGKVVVEPIATRTDKLTVVGNGKLDFATESIDLVWTLKPRRGIGLSGSTIINPFIKLGGTLASPKLDLKPVQAAVSTGAAVATAGLTLLFRGVYDRITAEKKVCDKALTKARRRIDRTSVDGKGREADDTEGGTGKAKVGE